MRKWKLPGPDEETLPVEAVARRFGYSLDYFRDLIRSGLFPPPRGCGNNQYYTGLDVAIITEMFGRWKPGDTEGGDEPPPPRAGRKTRESPAKPPESQA